VGVSVDSLDGLARHRGHYVARALRIAVRHVLDKSDGADRIVLRLPRSQCVHQTDDASRTAHIALHVLHVGGTLDGNATGIEADALADEGDRLIAALAAVPPQDHGAAGPGRALRHAKQRTNSQLRPSLAFKTL